MKETFTRFGKIALGIFLVLSAPTVIHAQTYTYVVEEFNFTNSSTKSESGDVDMKDFGIVGADDAKFNEVATTSNGQLRYEGIDESNEKAVDPISTGKIHVYMTLSSFNLEVEPTLNSATLGEGYSDGIERLIAVQLYENAGTSPNSTANDDGDDADVDIARLRFRADYRNNDTDVAMRIGGDNSQTASTGGYPFNFQKSDTAVTVGMTIDLDANTYAYWTNHPDEDDSKWFDDQSGRTGDLTSLDGLIFNEVEIRLDHNSSSYGDGGSNPEPRNVANFIEFDRILILHETTTIIPVPSSLASATEDNAVTISSSTTTTESVRVQGLTIDAGSTLTIADGHDITVVDQLVVNGELIVSSGGSLTTYGDITIGGSGVFTKERTTTYGASDGQYSAVGSSVSDASTDALGGIKYRYNENASATDLDARFEEITSAEPMTPGDGFFTANAGVMSFTGTPNTGDVDVSLTYNAAEGSDAGWNLVSNPYPSAIELTSFISQNSAITGATYFWDDGGSDEGARMNSDYIVVSASGTATEGSGSGRFADFDGYIKSEQGFFVQAVSAGTLSFNQIMKAGVTPNTASGYFREVRDNTNLLRVRLENETNRSDLVLEMNAQATLGYDRLFDARRINTGSEMSIFSFIENTEDEWAIQGISSTDLNGEIWLGIDITEAGEYTLNFEDGIKSELFLKDHFTGNVISLQEQSSYTFYSEENKIAEKRFSISASYSVAKVLGTDVLEENAYRAYFTSSELVVLSKDGFTNATVTVHDLQGRLLYNANNIDSNQRELILPFSTGKGVLIVNIYNINKKESIKLIR